MPTTDNSAARAVDAGWLAERLAAGDAPRVLDVRTPAEFESAHISGSYNVPLETLKEHRREIRQHLDEDIVLVCKAGQRAEQAERALASAGLPNVRVLTGGLQAWESAGSPVTRGRQKWELERQVRLAAGSIVLFAVLVSAFLPPLKWVAAGVGAGLAFAALRNSCAMGALLSKLPYNRGPSHDYRAAIDALAPSATRP